MAVSLYLAKVFGLYLTAIALGMFINRKHFHAAIEHMSQHVGLMFLSAVLTLIVGSFLVAMHNVWMGGWQIIITLICWAIFAKGVLRVIYPGCDKTWTTLLKNTNFYYMSAIVSLAFGIYLLYAGWGYSPV